MSRLRAKIAKKKMKRKAEYVNIDITGFRGYKGEQIIFFTNCSDPEMQQKILENKLTESERNFIVATVGEYFDDTCRINNDLFERGIGDLIIMYMNGEMSLPENLINQDFLQTCCRKKQKTGEMIFNKAKFKGMPLSEKINVVTDPMDFFINIWGEDYLHSNVDINNLIILNEVDSSDLEEEEDITATITSPFRRRFIKAGK